jgi:hypothetical protein
MIAYGSSQNYPIRRQTPVLSVDRWATKIEKTHNYALQNKTKKHHRDTQNFQHQTLIIKMVPDK